MVKLRGPMESLAAHGTLGNILNFSSKHGRAYARKKPKPTNNHQVTQLGLRAAVTFLTKQWQTLSPDEQATWSPLATSFNLPPYNAYLKENLTRAADNLSPTREYPATPTVYNAVVTNFTWKSFPSHLELSFRISANMNHWSVELHRAPIGGVQSGPHNLVHMVHPEETPTFTIVRDTPPAKGTWWYRFHLGSTTGTSGPFAGAWITQWT